MSEGVDNEELKLHLLAFREDVRQIVKEEIALQIEPIVETIGSVNDAGDGGSGLAGQAARTAARVDQLFSYKHVGTGIIIAVGTTGALLLLGFKSWLTNFLKT